MNAFAFSVISIVFLFCSFYRKYGYKILLKKLGNGKTVPVGKIKFSFPTYVEIDHVSEPEAAAGIGAKIIKLIFVRLSVR